MFERDDISGFKNPSTSSHKQKSHDVTWNGACVDTGPQKTVIGLPQAKEYCRFIGTKFKLKENMNVYRFGVGKQESLGSLKVILPTPEPLINLEIDVVQADVPLLIGLDVLDENGMTADTMNNVLKCPGRGWKIPLVRNLGHVYLEWKYGNIFFTNTELTKLHRSLYLPSNENLMNLIKRARPDYLDKDTMAILQNISQSCETCQRLGPRPIRFKVSIPPTDDIVFGGEVSIDIMFINGKAILHILATAIRFSAATFLDSNLATYGQSFEGV
jgi:hypothetical protein